MATTRQAPIWWSNAIFFTTTHLVTFCSIPYFGPSALDLIFCLVSWQLATFGITVGYHRLWSHRAFVATKPLRLVLAAMGCLGFQGSIRWWVLRHRIHHRWTDTEEDPYNASKGLVFSHMGWIFRKPVYSKMPLVDRKDLDADPVVRFQHKWYIPLTLSLGFLAPTLLGPVFSHLLPSLTRPLFPSLSIPLDPPASLDPRLLPVLEQATRGLIYGGLLARLLIWHFTFFINSLAHYIGERAYSQDISARGNYFLAIFTGGEANHNYHHVFPRDYRNGPAKMDWDPTKWIIYLLHHYTPLVPKIYSARPDDIQAARRHVLKHGHHHHHHPPSSPSSKSPSASASPNSFFKSLAESQRLSPSSPDPDSHSDSDSDSAGRYSSDDGALDSGYGTSSPRRAGSETDMAALMADKSAVVPSTVVSKPSLPTWPKASVLARVTDLALSLDAQQDEKGGLAKVGPTKRVDPTVLIIDGHAVDVTAFLASGEHPGGNAILKRFALPVLRPPPGPASPSPSSTEKVGVVGVGGGGAGDKPEGGAVELPDATESFFGGLNAHQWPARRAMRAMRIAKLV